MSSEVHVDSSAVLSVSVRFRYGSKLTSASAPQVNFQAVKEKETQSILSVSVHHIHFRSPLHYSVSSDYTCMNYYPTRSEPDTSPLSSDPQQLPASSHNPDPFGYPSDPVLTFFDCAYGSVVPLQLDP